MLDRLERSGAAGGGVPTDPTDVGDRLLALVAEARAEPASTRSRPCATPYAAFSRSPAGVPETWTREVAEPPSATPFSQVSAV